MASEQPFHTLFESFGRLPSSHADPVNRRAYEWMVEELVVPLEHEGRCILLRAPRAGHGKTHLLSRIQHHLAGSHEFVPVHTAAGARIDAASVMDDVLRRLSRPLPAAGGLCVLDLVTRRLFATALQPLVNSGEVPCQDREGALAALRNRPVETFDFHHPNAVTAHWARENFEVLGPRLTIELAQRTGLPGREVGFWVEALFRFAATPLDHPGRVGGLAGSVFGVTAGDGQSMERLSALLAMMTQLMRVVLVADDLEVFSADEGAALRLAAFLGTLRQSVERLDVILSLNQDIWNSAFVPRLSGGLADRLSEVVVELEPLTRDEMVALLESRLPGFGERVMEHIDVEEVGTHARGLMRAAATAWQLAARGELPTPKAVAPAPVVPPTVAAAFAAAVAEPVVAAPVISEPPPIVPPPLVPAAVVVAAEPEPVAWPSPVVEPPVVAVAPESPVAVVQAVDEPVAEKVEPTVEISPEPPVIREEAAFLSAAPPEFRVEPPVLSVGPPAFTAEPPAFTAEPPPIRPELVSLGADAPVLGSSPFSAAPQVVERAWTPPAEEPPMFFPAVEAPVEPVAPPIVPVVEPETGPFRFSEPAAPVEAPAFQSPFQASPEPPAQVFQAAPPAAEVWQAATAPRSPYGAPIGEVLVPESAPAAVVTPPPVTVSEPAAPDTDRVDDLLRQFRERYGRGGL